MVEKINVSEQEVNALLFMFYHIEYNLRHGHGLSYRQAFQFKKQLVKLIPKAEKIDINDYLSWEKTDVNT